MIFFVLICLLFNAPALGAGREDEASLRLVQTLVENIKQDNANDSFRQMILDKVMNEHTLSRHAKNQPYFYSDDSYVITDIINLLLDEPDGIIDETATAGLLKIYRDFRYHEEVEELFDREQRKLSKFQKNYLGQTISGPTNKVMVILKIKGDEQTLDTLEKRLTYIRNNIQYVDAYPVKGSPAPAKDESPKAKPEEELEKTG